MLSLFIERPSIAVCKHPGKKAGPALIGAKDSPQPIRSSQDVHMREVTVD
jgi:hypothetical protein